MTTQNRKKDDELLMWVIVGGIFTGLLLYMDIWYSSFKEMAVIARILIWVGHGVLAGLWVASLMNWKNPNYDIVRKIVVGLSIALALIVGIHHALTVENHQVIIDSQENAAKDTTK